MDGAGAAEEPRPLPTSLPPLGDNGAGAAVDVGVDGIHPVAGGKGKGRDGERSSQGSQRLAIASTISATAPTQPALPHPPTILPPQQPSPTTSHSSSSLKKKPQKRPKSASTSGSASVGGGWSCSGKPRTKKESAVKLETRRYKFLKDCSLSWRLMHYSNFKPPPKKKKIKGAGTFIGAQVQSSGTGKLVLKAQTVIADDLLYSPDGQFLVTVAHSKLRSVVTIRLTDSIRRGFREQTLHVLDPERGGHSYHTTAMAISRDSSMLATGGRDGTLFVWHLETGVRLLNLSKYQTYHGDELRNGIVAIDFSKTGTLITTMNEAGEVSIWAPRFIKHLHPKVLRQLVIFASAGGLEATVNTPSETRFNKYGAHNVDKHLKNIQDFAQTRTMVLRASDGLLHFDNHDFTWLSREDSVVAREAAARLKVLRKTNWKPPNTHVAGWRARDAAAAGGADVGKDGEFVEVGLDVLWSNDGSLVVTITTAAICVFVVRGTDIKHDFEGTKYVKVKEVKLRLGDHIYQSSLSLCNRFLFVAARSRSSGIGTSGGDGGGNGAGAVSYECSVVSLETSVVRHLKGPSCVTKGGSFKRKGSIKRAASMFGRSHTTAEGNPTFAIPAFARFTGAHAARKGMTETESTCQLTVGYASGEIHLWEIGTVDFKIVNRMDPPETEGELLRKLQKRSSTFSAASLPASPTGTVGSTVHPNPLLGRAGDGTGAMAFRKTSNYMQDGCLMRAKSSKELLTVAMQSKLVSKGGKGGGGGGGDGGANGPLRTASHVSAVDEMSTRADILNTSGASFGSMIRKPLSLTRSEGGDSIGGGGSGGIQSKEAKINVDIDGLFEQFSLLCWSSTM